MLEGDLNAPRHGLGLSDDAVAEIAFDHVFHLAAGFALRPEANELDRINVGGTRALITWLRARGFAGVFHYVSSIAAAGDHRGLVREDELDLGQTLHHPYHRSKYDAEQLVRGLEQLRWRIYRPSAVVGDSRTGYMIRSDGSYFLFSMARRLSRLPAWVPVINPRPGALNMVPVDFVAAALDALAHAPGWDGRTFHIVDPDPPSMLETFNMLSALAGGPRMVWTPDPQPSRPGLARLLSPVVALRDRVLAAVGVPVAAWKASNFEVSFATDNIDAALAGTGLRCPPQREYLAQLWDYWAHNLDPDRRS
ncbi:putative oxidoreductase [Enhygromyxa salina]|uniref:Putative oxidoreductase n=1 Tax=Enhygromyxa salina TaxID=215803 RepID=A0A0C2CYR0_9BACT|nr:putative oxidoreductase [Enhygromyxa salina]